MNVYNGNVVLDDSGEASVTLPDWFEALNRDFRYQLTAIGAPGPNLYVAEEVASNRFKIAGGGRGSKVSWQVTGIRRDEWPTRIASRSRNRSRQRSAVRSCTRRRASVSDARVPGGAGTDGALDVAVSGDGHRLVYSQGTLDWDIWRLDVRRRAATGDVQTRFIASTKIDCWWRPFADEGA